MIQAPGTPTPTVIHEDNHLLVLNKPPGLATIGVSDDKPSLRTWAAAYIKQRYQKPGNVFVGVVSRLDTLTSGVIVLARTSKCASRLSDQIRQHRFQKEYLAVVEGHFDTSEQDLVDLVFKDDQAHRMRIRNSDSETDHNGAQSASLRILSVDMGRVESRAYSLVRVLLLTGRKHQIRVQLSGRSAPIWGDRKYGAKTSEIGNQKSGRGIALHSHSLTLTHPTTSEVMQFCVPPPDSWAPFLKNIKPLDT